MSLTSSTQTQIAFKNLLGKSQTKVMNDIVNEPYGISFDIPSKNVWLDTIYASASTTIAQGSTVKVTADLVAIPGADNYAFFTKWPSTAPIGNDIKTGLPFQYGVGSLSGLTGGDRMLSLISDSLGSDFEAKPFAGSTPIPVLDDRNWIYQYNSGIFYQDNITSTGVWTYTTPTKIDVYPYIGSKLAVINTQENIRVTAYGTNSYYATYSTPTIATYSSNYLYLVDFVNANTSGTVSLNINNIGTVSVYRYGQDGVSNLQVGQITGATGATAGPIYYLTYNSGVFQFFDSNPVQSNDGYKNLAPTINSVGGLDRGSSFNDVLLQDVFTDLLYPEQLGNINNFKLFNSGGSEVIKFEIGDSMSPGSYTFSWNLSGSSFEANSVKLQDITNVVSTGTYWTTPSGYIATGLTNSSPYTWILGSTISSTLPTSRDFRVYINRDNLTTISKSLSVNWMFPIYTGSTSSTSITGLQVLSNLTNKILATSSNVLLTIPGSGYKYVAVPETFNSIYSLTLDKIQVVMAATAQGYTNSFSNSLYYNKIWVTSSYGIGATYNVYRSLNSISTSIDLVPSDSIQVNNPVYTGLAGATGPTGPIGPTGQNGNITDIGITFSTSSSYNLTSVNVNKVLAMSHSTTAIVYIQPYSTTSIAVGSQIMLTNWSGITMSVGLSGSGMFLYSADSATRIRTRYSTATLIQMSQNVWLLTGDITT
jgi:hypothetical protein